MNFNILAFGDSLTWGSDHQQGSRHAFQDRWPNVLAAGLGGAATVVAEGLGGRTTCFDDHMSPSDRNGARILPTLLGSHYPVDLLIIMLGANDLKPHICGRAAGAAAGIDRLIEIAQSFPYGWGAAAPKVLVVSPPIFAASRAADGLPAGGRDIAESQRLAAEYEAVARRRGCSFFDAASVAKASVIDGVHLDAENTRNIGLALVPVVASIIKTSS
ncbi:GDSL-like Lipase/Acylhydrolase [Bosea sp. LC85]|uniref:SGNH/GDSL hydrolase family protein n=1 Tax=Bosea sp. LC85 TaxID=1502851 RepID=UPI0004E30E72|nr:SGNH/GDSL hydrolase family protein [Bosea sp. LC85]KFC69413.1 GDSL-like Lipase/Acylhydrolase [Bosea sp. LC85]